MCDIPLVQKRGLIKSNPRTSKTPIIKNNESHNLSLTILPDEMQQFLNESQQNTESFLNKSLNPHIAGGGVSFCDPSITENQQNVDMLFRNKADVLFSQFLEVLQARTNDSEVFDTVQDLIQTCAGVLEQTQKNAVHSIEKKWLEQETKTWKLLYALYKDRILVQNADQNMDYDVLNLNASEKAVITQLYSSNSTLREYQLIIDWLEACYEKRQKHAYVGHANGRGVAWENTLFQLKQQKQIAFGSGNELVKCMDPDAPLREKKSLHALDEDDNVRLSCAIFEEIRQGHIDDAIALCKYCGQSWRAAILEGWRLHDDPNYDPSCVNSREKLPIEGNPRRDIWKKCAWYMAEHKKCDEYTRAIAGAFCGHLDSLKSLSGNTWEDLLWSYLKVQVDIRVESEIRACSMRSYQPMPEAYWNSKMSLELIFDELSVHNDPKVRGYAQSKIAIIQKYLILDNVIELLQQMRHWLNRNENVEASINNSEPITAHMLRFFTHIVLFMRQIGRLDREESADLIIAAYVECLIRIGDAQLVAFYTAALPTKMQTILYSKFLETITETQIRSVALEQALSADLDVENITRHTVETIREKQQTFTEQEVDLGDKAGVSLGDISKFDMQKIKALEWLTFLPSQRGELLWQANAMIRIFLAENKSDCVRATYEMIPPDSLAQIIKAYDSKDNLPCREECSIKEYLSYKVYLTAIDNFNEWTRLYYNRPKSPEQLGADANFTDRVASEHKTQMYRGEINRWKTALEEQVKVCRDSLFNVLVFPDKGWLTDPDTVKDVPSNIDTVMWECRQIQMEKLRSICIPEVVLLLYKVLNISGDYEGCIKLADEIASENRKLYKVYTKHKLADLLAKLAETSLQLLNKKLDPWGYTMNI